MSGGSAPGERSGPVGKVGGERRFTGRVIGVDVDPLKVECINRGSAPFYELGLTDLLVSIDAVK